MPTVYSLEEEVITCVGLAPAKAGVFMTAVKYVLVLCTRVEVILLGVCFSGDDSSRQVRCAAPCACVLPLPYMTAGGSDDHCAGACNQKQHDSVCNLAHASR